MSDACLVCFQSGRCDLDGAEKALVARGMTVFRMDNQLFTKFGNGPMLRIAFATGDYVAAESADIASRSAYAKSLLPCEARFEVLIDDLDAVLDEINTLIEVQLTLKEATGGFLFNTWNCKIVGEKQ